MNGELNITISEEQGQVPVTILQLTGALDANTYGGLEAKAREAIDGGAKNMLLEMSNVSYIGSAGLRAIHVIANLLYGDGGEDVTKSKNLKIVNPIDDVRKIFKTLGFDAHVEIIDGLDNAIASF